MLSSFSHGAITDRNNEGTLFKVNGQCLKLFLEPNNELEEVDIITFFQLKYLGLTLLLLNYWRKSTFF